MDQGPSSLLSPPELTPLEQEVLDEYERLADNMKKVNWHKATVPPPLSFQRFALNSAQHGRLRIQIAFCDLPLTWFPSRQLAMILEDLASNPSTEILDGLRDLERKTSLAFTLLKASVYSIVLQQEIDWGDGSGGGPGDAQSP